MSHDAFYLLNSFASHSKEVREQVSETRRNLDKIFLYFNGTKLLLGRYELKKHFFDRVLQNIQNIAKQIEKTKISVTKTIHIVAHKIKQIESNTGGMMQALKDPQYSDEYKKLLHDKKVLARMSAFFDGSDYQKYVNRLNSIANSFERRRAYFVTEKNTSEK